MTIKKVVLHVSGIINKDFTFIKKVGNFDVYYMNEEHNKLIRNYQDEQLEYQMKWLNIFVDVQDHLFMVASLKNIESLASLSEQDILNHFDKLFNDAIEENKLPSFGYAQFSNRILDYENAKLNKKHADKLKELEKEKIEQEKLQKEESERLEQLTIAENRLLNNEWISNTLAVQLFDKYEIKLPLRTRGWIINKLENTSMEQYEAHSKSTVYFEYLGLLIEAMQEQKQAV